MILPRRFIKDWKGNKKKVICQFHAKNITFDIKLLTLTFSPEIGTVSKNSSSISHWNRYNKPIRNNLFTFWQLFVYKIWWSVPCLSSKQPPSWGVLSKARFQVNPVMNFSTFWNSETVYILAAVCLPPDSCLAIINWHKVLWRTSDKSNEVIPVWKTILLSVPKTVKNQLFVYKIML